MHTHLTRGKSVIYEVLHHVVSVLVYKAMRTHISRGKGVLYVVLYHVVSVLV